eukprot:773828-Pyramimonas_sp.AAC.1
MAAVSATARNIMEYEVLTKVLLLKWRNVALARRREGAPWIAPRGGEAASHTVIPPPEPPPKSLWDRPNCVRPWRRAGWRSDLVIHYLFGGLPMLLTVELDALYVTVTCYCTCTVTWHYYTGNPVGLGLAAAKLRGP